MKNYGMMCDELRRFIDREGDEELAQSMDNIATLIELSMLAKLEPEGLTAQDFKLFRVVVESMLK